MLRLLRFPLSLVLICVLVGYNPLWALSYRDTTIHDPEVRPVVMSLHGGVAYAMPTFSWRQSLMSSYTYPIVTLRMGYDTRCNSPDSNAAWLGYPTVGVDVTWSGLGLCDYIAPSHLDNLTSFNVFFDGRLISIRRFSLRYDIAAGVALNSAVYNRTENPRNENFNGAMLIAIGVGLNVVYRLSPAFEVGVAGRLGHYSSGRLAFPNHGINELIATASLTYRPNYKASSLPLHSMGTRFCDRLFYEVYAAQGLHRCSEEWKAFKSTTPWPTYSLGASINNRILPAISAGVGLDINAVEQRYLNRMRDAQIEMDKHYGMKRTYERENYDPISVGSSIVARIHYGNFALRAQIGLYLYRNQNDHELDGWHYERVGVQYIMPKINNFFVGADVYAHHLSRAAAVEFNIGMLF